jgi:signal transduction histidine kinase
LLVRFTGQGLTASAYNLRASLVRAVIGAAGLAAVLALLAAVLVSRRITRPVTRIIESARTMGRGDRRARVGQIADAPAEVQELGAAFDQMADSLTAQEQLRRNVVADVAHELRTPVAVLQANTEALLDGLVAHTPEQTASLHEEVKRLGRMVEDLQILAAAEAAALEVSDTGPGISPDDQAHVFDRLWRGADAAQTAGSGIGLAVAAELARAHGGSIDVVSELGSGSRFTLVLPLALTT